MLSQRIRIGQAARLRSDLIDRHGDQEHSRPHMCDLDLDLDLPGRKTEYLHAVADAALEGAPRPSRTASRRPGRRHPVDPKHHRLGPFAAELVVLRGANAPDVLPPQRARLDTRIVELYGTNRRPAKVSEAWRPYRTWAAVHPRALREQRTHLIGGPQRH